MTNEDYNLERADLKLVQAGLPRWYLASLIRLTTIKKHMKITDDVLEIGCGYTHPFMDILTKDNYQCINTYHGVDMCKLEDAGSSYYTLQGNFDFVTEWTKLCSKFKYSKIVHIEVIEHMRKELGKEFLRGCWNLLEDDGTMIFSTPVGAPDRKMSPNHIHEYGYNEMYDILQDNGWKVRKVLGCWMDIKHLDSAYDFLKYHLSNDVLSCVFAVNQPENSRNCLWMCKKGL